MAKDRIDDNVGKKIVEALKMQDQSQQEDEIFYNTTDENEVEDIGTPLQIQEEDLISEPTLNAESAIGNEIPSYNNLSENSQRIATTSFVDNAFQQSLERNLGSMSINNEVSYPTNIEVLRQLIGKLPAGVSKQTGAIIIQQTMEALGISMKNVIAEARQFQSELNSKVRECQANIIDYRKQISVLEAKSQQYQKQFSMLNDIISLFINP